MRRLAVPVGEPRHTSLVELALLFGILATALFWATAAYSQQLGEERAASINANPAALLPDVTVHSVDELNLWTDGGPVQEPGKFTHTYRGLRLLAYANDRWFLLTGDLTPAGRHRFVVIRDEDTVRVDLST